MDFISEKAGLGPYSFDIRGTDTDDHDRLHLSSLFSFMQEAAYHNAQALGIGSGQLDVQGLCWLLIRISVRLSHLPQWGETIKVNTWSRGAERLIFLRDYEFYDQAGALFGCATSEWLIASQNTHRPQRPDKILPPGYQPPGARAVFAGPVARLVPLAGPAANQSILTKYADYSDIDRNHHVNNTRYVAWCMDTIHALVRGSQEGADPAVPPMDSMADLYVRGLDIHYISELRLGSKIHCYGLSLPLDAESGTEYRMEARRSEDDSAVFRARVLI